jgi:hypothetical protein
MRAYMVAGRATKLAVPQEKALPACRLGRTLSLMVPLKEDKKGPKALIRRVVHMRAVAKERK